MSFYNISTGDRKVVVEQVSNGYSISFFIESTLYQKSIAQSRHEAIELANLFVDLEISQPKFLKESETKS
jgi:hypothetical protein